MANEKRDGDEREKRLERMRQLLAPISEERAREIGNRYTRHMQEAVERTRRQERNLGAGGPDD